MSEFEESLDRTRSIEWDSSSDSKRSQVRLFQEYLRRAALWAAEFKAPEWPFYDIAKSVVPDFRAPETRVQEALSSIPEGGTFYTFKTIEWSLHFAALRDRESRLSDHRNPFEPLILIYERGSMVNLSPAGFIEIGHYSLPKKDPEKCRQLKPMSNLSEQSLSEIDKNQH
ncbi:hypothetical protein [Nocardiopsis sp. YSL2]|uniref:hypothetical protein n=1 Tax=Nocardiopsis sp. YSL2 TaxID=2939492 RepID=UPI0026F456A7|nr:hypothetical protein [Nocardiopsis sp. YSL2]